MLMVINVIYIWNILFGLVNIGLDNSIMIFNFIMNDVGSYQVFFIEDGCFFVFFFVCIIQVNVNLMVEVFSNSFVCGGVQLQFFVNGLVGFIYIWQILMGIMLSGLNIIIFFVNLDFYIGVFVVIVQCDGCQFELDMVMVVINEMLLVFVNFISNGLICVDELGVILIVFIFNG